MKAQSSKRVIKRKRECLFLEQPKVLRRRKSHVCCCLASVPACTISSKYNIIDWLMYGLPRKPWKEGVVSFLDPLVLLLLISGRMHFCAARGAVIAASCVLVLPDQSSAGSHEGVPAPCASLFVCLFAFLTLSGRTGGHASTKHAHSRKNKGFPLLRWKTPFSWPNLFRWPPFGWTYAWAAVGAFQSDPPRSCVIALRGKAGHIAGY